MYHIHLDSIDSTNTYAKQHCQEFPPNQIACITAEEQTAGRGRHNRAWLSPRALNLYVTFYFTLPLDTLHLSSLSELLAYSLATLLIEDHLQPKLKWPNDILLSNKKLSGVLSELAFHPSHIDCFLGIGVNVNMSAELLSQINQPATSLLVETNHHYNRDTLLKNLQRRFTSHLEQFKKSGFTSFHQPFENLLAFKGQTIRFFDGKKEWTGICHSLATDGRLNLYLPDHTIQTIASGEITAVG